MKNDSSDGFDDVPFDFSFSDKQPRPENPIHGLIQYFNVVSNKQDYTNHENAKIQEELSRYSDIWIFIKYNDYNKIQSILII